VSDIEQFAFGGQKVRVVDRDGEPWWIAKDVCQILGYNHTPHAVRRLDDDEYSQFTPSVRVGHHGPPARPVTIVNEAGLYALILGSAKPDARTFKRWVTHEVLPSIRRTGRYEAAPVDVDMNVTLRFAEAYHREHVVPASGRILAYQRWNKPQDGMKAFGEICVQLELDITPGTATGITGGDQ
jgi:prophage antirepressor-like protein